MVMQVKLANKGFKRRHCIFDNQGLTSVARKYNEWEGKQAVFTKKKKEEASMCCIICTKIKYK